MGVTSTTASANTYVPIATTTLSSAAASYTFSSISSAYTDLVLVFNGYASTGTQNINIQVGNTSIDTATNYSYTILYGTGTAAGSSRAATQSSIVLAYPQSTQGTNAIVQIQNYSNTTTYKTLLSRGNNAAYEIDATVGLWRSTAAIDTIKLNISAGNFVIGSTFTLYGIAAA